uniref:NADH-ubiquinone oxidoreductase chain 3 n=1 Tax=Hyperolius ocellatus TaxID=191618 RepID=S4V274_HYPOE|nr:NADH dehydrogenase subunit 3 [Hyperolius ocellatus]
MLMYVHICIALCILLAIVSFWLPNLNPDSEKLSPYECGFNPLGNARLPYSLRFFLVAIMFLIFDLEIALLLPTPWAMQMYLPTLSMVYITIIIIILVIGFIYEWTRGGLEWAE